MSRLDFSASAPLSLGVELELQVLEPRECDLTHGATDLLALVSRMAHPGDIKPEITGSMVEISTGVHATHATLLAELRAQRDVLVRAGDRLNLLVAGGGTHPFQQWSDRRIVETPRFQQISGLYGYLAKQFTVFGQHIHVGCPGGDDAMRLLHAMSRYVPHFIALSAASPYYQGVDTAFDSARLNSISAFPLSGRAPFVLRWDEFNEYYAGMLASGIVGSMKDFYWDIRPKPEFGTIEIRVCDTPLTVERAAALAAYAQALAAVLLASEGPPPHEDLYRVYGYNRFQASRFGMDAIYVDPDTHEHVPLREDILRHVARAAALATDPGTSAALLAIAEIASNGNDARWLREQYAGFGSFPELVWHAAQRWRGG